MSQLDHTCADDSDVILLSFVKVVLTESHLTDSPFADSRFIDNWCFL